MMPLGTKRHSYSEFVGTLDDGIGNDAVETDGGQDKREDGKGDEQDRYQTSLGKMPADS
jgi:hypothetical protein